MSLFSALNSATAGLRTVQASVKLVSDNVARADDPNRTRHTLQQMVDKSGFVVTAEYRREMDNGMKAQLETLIAREGSSAARNTYMTKLGDLMRTTGGEPLLNKYASEFSAAWRTLETTPENEVASYQLVQSANTFATEIRRVAEGVEALDRELRNDLSTSMKELNRLLSEVDKVNKEIVSLRSYGNAANEVADKRDGLIRQISELVGVRTVDRPDGRVALFTPSGLALVDAAPANIAFDGGRIVLQIGNSVQDVSEQMKEGKIGALYNMVRDGSQSDPPQPVSADPSSEIIRKLRSQLDTYARAFVAPTKPGEPTSFADAYDKARPLVEGEQDIKFFVGNDRFTLRVNDKILNNEAKIKNSAIRDVVTAINASGRSLTADGLRVEDATYAGMASNITGMLMSTAKSVNDTFNFDKGAKELIQERYHSLTGVNIDEEIAMLQQLQTSYAASARVMQVTNSMFDALERIVG
ncbi:flagellar hook-associated protein FlgK [Azospirillum halopraeferens]|uniref:flagellar hook-associated protein FlgK n=1 Tax=Azospirillum halopraeferens TaxID=34010 RepID=UPI000418BFD2|nr:flagellar hook-associated protein FlgK [Azospirillum halopraeferens]